MKLYNIKNKADLDQAVKENTSPLKAIRLRCLDCSVFQLSEVRECSITTCPLWNFRLGRNPFRSTGRKELSEEERVLLGRRLAESRKNS